MWGLKLDIEPTICPTTKWPSNWRWRWARSRARSSRLAHWPTRISTRNASTAPRLKDGDGVAGWLAEQGGPYQRQPHPVGRRCSVLGRLFSSQLDDGSRTELVLAITPRIVRNLRQPDRVRPNCGWALRPIPACARWAGEWRLSWPRGPLRLVALHLQQLPRHLPRWPCQTQPSWGPRL